MPFSKVEGSQQSRRGRGSDPFLSGLGQHCEVRLEPSVVRVGLLASNSPRVERLGLDPELVRRLLQEQSEKYGKRRISQTSKSRS